MLGAALSAAVLATTFQAAPLQARELRYAIGQPPGALPVKGGEKYADALKQYSNGKLTARVYAMSLLNMAETSEGVRDGIADIGFVLTPYFPSEYPHTNLISEASMMLRLMGDDLRGKEGMAFIPAMSEFIFQKCPECNTEFEKQNQVYTGHIGGSSYGLICNKPVSTREDMQGKRFRVGAANWSRWVSQMGGTPITMSANEMLEALMQGVVDCIVLSSPEIHNFGLRDAVTDISMTVPGGIFTTAGQNVNRDVWKKLSVEERQAMMRASAVAAAEVPFSYHLLENKILAELEAKGVKMHQADKGLVDATHNFIESDMQAIADYFSSKHGVKRGTEMITEFRQILEKWVGLIDKADGDVNKYADLYWEEVFSKVDVAKHGV
nr:C4-dicarboxylate TRAP transporter substrate-binding protein [Pseudomonas sp.]